VSLIALRQASGSGLDETDPSVYIGSLIRDQVKKDSNGNRIDRRGPGTGSA